MLLSGSNYLPVVDPRSAAWTLDEVELTAKSVIEQMKELHSGDRKPDSELTSREEFLELVKLAKTLYGPALLKGLVDPQK